MAIGIGRSIFGLSRATKNRRTSQKSFKSRGVYWGLVHIIEIKHDYLNETTSGKFKIIYINTPEEMKQAHDLIDRNPETNYFAK